MKKILRCSLACLFVVVLIFMFGNQTRFIYHLFAGTMEKNALEETDVKSLQDTEQYIRQLKPFTQSNITISKEDSGDVFDIKGNQEELHVLQVTDVHISGEEENYTNNAKAMKAVYDLVQREQPDFIVLTGDLIYATEDTEYEEDLTSLKLALNFMNQLGVPWTWTYGNHDHHLIDLMDTDTLNQLLQSCTNLYMPEISEQVTGSNAVFKFYQDDTLKNAVITMDSNGDIKDDDDDFITYGYIDDTQVAWYKANVKALTKEAGQTVNTTIFTHIPLQEYDQEVEDLSGERGEEVDCSDVHSKLFQAILSLKSTTGVFCGHDHLNNTISLYKGIYLVYAKSIDYTAYVGIDQKIEQRGACSILLNQEELNIENVQYQINQ